MSTKYVGFGDLKQAEARREAQSTEARATEARATKAARPGPKSRARSGPGRTDPGPDGPGPDRPGPDGPEFVAFTADPARGHTAIWNDVLDTLLPSLDPCEQLVYLRVYRLTSGFGRAFCQVSLDRLAEKTRLGRSTVKRALASLAARGLVRRSSVTDGPVAARGLHVELLAPKPPASPVRPGPGQKGPGQSGPHERFEKQHEKPAASAPAGVVFQIRQKAVRLREILSRENRLTRDRLLAQVRTAIDADGIEATDTEIDEAIRGMA